MIGSGRNPRARTRPARARVAGERGTVARATEGLAEWALSAARRRLPRPCAGPAQSRGALASEARVARAARAARGVRGPRAQGTHRDRGIDGLDVGLVHEEFAGALAERLDLGLGEVLAAHELLDLAVQVRGGQRGHRGGHQGRARCAGGEVRRALWSIARRNARRNAGGAHPGERRERTTMVRAGAGARGGAGSLAAGGRQLGDAGRAGEAREGRTLHARGPRGSDRARARVLPARRPARARRGLCSWRAGAVRAARPLGVEAVVQERFVRAGCPRAACPARGRGRMGLTSRMILALFSRARRRRRAA